jgi:hypothetical protein
MGSIRTGECSYCSTFKNKKRYECPDCPEGSPTFTKAGMIKHRKKEHGARYCKYCKKEITGKSCGCRKT